MRAAVDAIRMSIGRVRVIPTPAAGPLVAAITRLAELAKHRRGDRVEPIPAVQGYRADSVLDVVADLAEGHHCPSWNSIRPSVVPSEALASPASSRSAGMLSASPVVNVRAP